MARDPDQQDAESERNETRLRGMIGGYRASAMLHSAALLGLADLLADGPRPVEDMAAETKTHAPSLLRVLRGLVVLGLLEETAPERFVLTPLGALLKSDAPGGLRGAAISGPSEQQMRVWGNLLHTVRTGETTYDHVLGTSAFEYFAQHPEISKVFNAAMAAHTRQVAPLVLSAYDFSPFRTIVDLGGGDGTLIAAILAAAPAARGVVFDTASGAARAKRQLERAGLAGRAEVVFGDFFQSVPAGGDLYTLKSIVHDWNDERATTLLANCRRAMRDDAKLLIIDLVLPPSVDVSEPTRTIVISDVNMLVNTGGRERTRDEFAGLLAATGFRPTAFTPIDRTWGYHLIEAVPAGRI
jgi:hypothetical protein